MRSLFFLAAILAILPAGLSAQRLNPGPSFAARPAGGPVSPGFAAAYGFHRHEGFGHRSPYGLAYFSEPLYADDFFSAGYPVASAPSVIVMQAPAPAAPALPAPPAEPVQPLMIELQGGHYVRVSGEPNPGTETLSGLAVSVNPPESAPRASLQVAPVVLVFRDGHREEVTDYTIEDGALYVRSDFYTSGSWNRKIEISSLNVPETVKLNQSRGVDFHLPTAPNQVIVRP